MSIYFHTEDIHNMEAPRAVVPLLIEKFQPESVLDVGCGIGTWLKAFEEAGVEDYLGLDGDHVDRQLLKIPAEKFRVQNLTEPWNLKRTFDLVICLEVAEHLDERSADLFVERLVHHAKTIIFSAAVPGQGGQNHLNEQWPSYWKEKFAKHGFYFHDALRPLIWFNPHVQWWYSQNAFVVNQEPSSAQVINAIHPIAFTERVRLIEDILSGEIGLQMSLGIVRKAFGKWLRKKVSFVRK